MRRTVHLLLLLGFLTTVSYPAVPTPTEVLGFAPGADKKLADWSQIREYFLRLDAASDRIVTRELGDSTLGKPMLLAIISSPANLRRLEEYRRIQAALADPRIKREKPEVLTDSGKVVVLVTCGIHSTEPASPLTAVALAYDLATSREPKTLQILDRVILLLVPSLNPDGTTLVAEWYKKTLGTPAEGTSPPELYHPYTGHDNNRDWFMFTQKETRLLVEKVHQQWHPQIVVDLHQMGPNGARLFVPPYIDPIDPNVDPILQAEIADLGTSIQSSMVREGKAGVVVNAIFDAFTPGRSYQHYHGGVRILMEAASARLASPITVTGGQMRPGSDFDPTQPSWNFPLPWQPGVWRISDIVAYQKSAVEACLLHAARFKTEWLSGFYRVGLNAINRREPYAFIIPADQKDAQGLLDLLEILRFGQVDVKQAERAFQVSAKLISSPYGSADRTQFPRQSFVVPAGQPYGAFAKTLLERQNYRMPTGTGLRTPYDITGHTLGLLLGLEVYRADQAFDFSATPLAGGFSANSALKISGDGPYCLFSHQNNAFAPLINRFLKAGSTVSWAPNGFQAEGKGFPTGTLMARYAGDSAGLAQLAQGLPVTIERFGKAPQLAWQELRSPRIAMYRSHEPVADEGWTRWILEKNEFVFQSVTNKDVRGDGLAGRDVIIFCSQDPKSIMEGLSEPYPEEYRGGIGPEGLARLKAFVEQGGVLLLLGSACGLAKQMGLEVEDKSVGLDRGRFYIPGTLLRATVNNRHPIGYGMGPETAVMFEGSPFFDVSHGLPIVRYAGQDVVLSGWARGENLLSNQSGLTELRIGQGAVVLIGFRTQFRAQARATFKFLFNCLYYATTFRNS